MVHMEDASEIFASTFSWTPLNLDLSTEQGESPYISLNVSKHCLSPCEPHNRREWWYFGRSFSGKGENMCCVSLQCLQCFLQKKMNKVILKKVSHLEDKEQ